MSKIIRGLELRIIINLLILIVLAVASNMVVAQDMTETVTDAQILERVSLKILRKLEEKHPDLAPLNNDPQVKAAVKKLSQKIASSKFYLDETVLSKLTNYKDVVIFSSMLRVAKLLVVYPILTVTGNGWLVAVSTLTPDVEILTGIYYYGRQWLKSKKFYEHYKVKRKDLDQKAAEFFNDDKIDRIHFHIVKINEEEKIIPIRRKSFLELIRYMKEKNEKKSFISRSSLEELIGDKEYLKQVKNLSYNGFLYEDILIQKVLSMPDKRDRLISKIDSLRWSQIEKGVSYAEFENLTQRIDTLLKAYKMKWRPFFSELEKDKYQAYKKLVGDLRGLMDRVDDQRYKFLLAEFHDQVDGTTLEAQKVEMIDFDRRYQNLTIKLNRLLEKVQHSPSSCISLARAFLL